jgi:purine-binding chemotaxis protein CheW
MRGEEILEAKRRREESTQVKTEHHDLLRLSLDEEWYGIDIADVVEVRECPRIFKIPHTPDYVVGVANLSGEILTIIDIRKLLELSTTPSGDYKHIVVVERDNVKVGILVDRASDVVSILDSDVKPSLSAADKARSLVAGEALLDGKLLLSIDSKFQTDLDNGDISEELRRKFGNRYIPLSQDATVSTEKKDKRWLITESNRTIYIVRKEEGKLNVYDGEALLAILDLDALTEE